MRPSEYQPAGICTPTGCTGCAACCINFVCLRSSLRASNAYAFLPRHMTAIADSMADTRQAHTSNGGNMVDTGGAQRHPAATERLMNYWAHGTGAIKINWGVPGDFDRCVTELSKYVGPGVVKGLCANLHHEATGAWPGHAPSEQAGHKG